MPRQRNINNMKIIEQNLKPRRTNIVARAREALRKGQKSIPLVTAVDVFGAHNMAGQFPKFGFEGRVRLRGKEVRLVLNAPTKLSTAPGKRNHTRLRNKIIGLKKGEVLVLSTPNEAHAFINMRQSIRDRDIPLHTMRNCTNLLIWKRN